MLPGHTYSFDDVVRIATKRKWLIVVPFVAATLAVVLYTRTLPDQYRSQTTILVVPQRIPEAYVKSTVTTRIEDRLSTIQQQLMSRSQLERIIREFDLYPGARKALPMEDVVDLMRTKIQVLIERGDAFSVAFVHENPRIAQKVTERLASIFIDENLQDREVMAEGTSQFLEAQLEDARRQLIEQEKRLEEYRRQHNGELPTQVESNLQAIQSTQLQLQALSESIDRDKDRRLVLERQLLELQNAPHLVPMTPASGGSIDGGVLADLQAAQDRLNELERRYTPEHPDVIAAKRLVRELNAKVQALGSGSDPSPVQSPAEIARENRMRDLRTQLTTLDAQISRKQNDEQALREQVGTYQSKVNAAPTRETELTELTRDYATLQNTYTSLLAKREDSKLSANLERRQVGEQFKVLDPARVPERAFSPNRLRINVLGSMAGLLVGLGFVAFLEFRDGTLKTQGDVSRVLQLTVLAVVPMIESTRDRQVRRRRLLLAAGVAVLVVCACAGLAAWKMQVF